jgi:hypothetical protein
MKITILFPSKNGIENKEIGGITDSTGDYTIDITNIDKTETFKVIANEYEPFKVSCRLYQISKLYIKLYKKNY